MSIISNLSKPAILGYESIFKTRLHLTVPDIPDWESVHDDLKTIFDTGMLTKGPKLVEFESALVNYLNVKNVIAVSSCTSGLMLSYKGLNLEGEVILPSFTFMSTGQALMWIKNVTPVFVDIDPDTLTIDPKKVEEAITPNTCAIVAVHVYGNPASIDELQSIAAKHNLKLIFDAAHAVGSKYQDKPIGSFGNVECFSCSPTKILITGEGGIVSTKDDKLAEFVKIGREYGNPGNYDSLFSGMNARMSEFSAIMGIHSLKMVDNIVKTRNEYANYLTKRLKNIPGIKFQKIEEGNTSTYKDYTLIIQDEFGLTRDQLEKAIHAENIDTRNYYVPPLHQQTTYKNIFKGNLNVTEDLCKRVITVPLSSRFTLEEIERIADAIERVYKYREEIKKLIIS